MIEKSSKPSEKHGAQKRRRRVAQRRGERRRGRAGEAHAQAAAFNILADSSRHHNPWAADIYQRARARGAGHAHAARILGRAWSQVIWRLWQDHDTYTPATHPALQRLIAAAA